MRSTAFLPAFAVLAVVLALTPASAGAAAQQESEGPVGGGAFPRVDSTVEFASIVDARVPDEPAGRGEQAGSAETAAGWVKHPRNPVLGGDLGTCFDVSVLKEGGKYRMWFSWRPKKSIALVESQDGVQWSKPLIVLGPNEKTDWEDDLNRPVVLKNGTRYQMWYTGQARGQSWIGYAVSQDGKTWQRMSSRPVLSADEPWENVAVMCPHVLYDDEAEAVSHVVLRGRTARAERHRLRHQ